MVPLHSLVLETTKASNYADLSFLVGLADEKSNLLLELFRRIQAKGINIVDNLSL
jgi:hypothetical protein